VSGIAVSRPDISWSSGVAAAYKGLQPWTINMATSFQKRKGPPCRRQRTYHGFRDGDGRKARRLRRPALRLWGLTTIPIPELWAAVVIMPRYAYDKKNLTGRSPLDSAHISQAEPLLRSPVPMKNSTLRSMTGAGTIRIVSSGAVLARCEGGNACRGVASEFADVYNLIIPPVPTTIRTVSSCSLLIEISCVLTRR
jgi:hypothetical protein